MYSKLTIHLLILLSLSSLCTCIWLPKIVWTYTHQLPTNQSYLYLFKTNHEIQCKDWQVRFLHKDNYLQYISKIPEYGKQLQNLGRQLFSQEIAYMKMLIIKQYGGVWVDFYSVQIQNIKWIDEVYMKGNPDVENRVGNKPQFFSFSQSIYGKDQIYFNKQSNMNMTVYPGYDLDFIASVKNSQFSRQLLKYQKMIIRSSRGQKIPQLQQYLLPEQYQQKILENKQAELDANKTEPRQLAANYYKIWHIKSEKGPLNIRSVVENEQIFYMMKMDLGQLKRYKFTPRYLMRIIGDQLRYLEKHILHGSYQWENNFQAIMKNLLQLNNFGELAKYFCPEQFTIKNNSIVQRYLIRDRKQYQVNNNTSIFNNGCPVLHDFLNKLVQRQHKLVEIGLSKIEDVNRQYYSQAAGSNQNEVQLQNQIQTQIQLQNKNQQQLSSLFTQLLQTKQLQQKLQSQLSQKQSTPNTTTIDQKISNNKNTIKCIRESLSNPNQPLSVPLTKQCQFIRLITQNQNSYGQQVKFIFAFIFIMIFVSSCYLMIVRFYSQVKSRLEVDSVRLNQERRVEGRETATEFEGQKNEI